MKKIISFLLVIAISVLSTFTVMAGADGSNNANAANNAVSEVFEKIAGKEFTLMNGIGTWETVLTINPDGTFTGSYMSANMMGNTGSLCEFSGKFSVPVKEDDYTYTMTLENLSNDGPFEEYVDDNGRTISPSTPFGVDGGREFKLFMVGHPVSTLPSTFINALMIPSSITTLDLYGLLNVDKNLSFHTPQEEVSESAAPAVPETTAATQETTFAAPETTVTEVEEITAQTGNTNSSLVTFYVNPINDYINVRSQPAHNSALMGTVGFYDEMYFYGETSTGYGSDGVLHYWYKITSNYGVSGWVRSDLVSTVPNGRSVVRSYSDTPVSVFYVDPINSYINVRSQPAHNSALVGTVMVYEVMYFYGETGTGYGSDGVLHYWYKIVSSSGVSGWVRSDLVSAVATSYNVSSSYSSSPVMVLYVYPGNSYINVRTQATHFSALAGTVQSYEDIYFYGESATGLGSDGYVHLWYKVKTERGVSGWVRSDLVGVLYY